MIARGRSRAVAAAHACALPIMHAVGRAFRMHARRWLVSRCCASRNLSIWVPPSGIGLLSLSWRCQNRRVQPNARRWRFPETIFMLGCVAIPGPRNAGRPMACGGAVLGAAPRGSRPAHPSAAARLALLAPSTRSPPPASRRRLQADPPLPPSQPGSAADEAQAWGRRGRPGGCRGRGPAAAQPPGCRDHQLLRRDSWALQVRGWLSAAAAALSLVVVVVAVVVVQ